MNPNKTRVNQRFDAASEKTGKRRKLRGLKLAERRAEILHLKLFLRRVCPECSETTVAEEVRQLHHVQRVQAHPERHEIDVWVGFPAEGLMREIVRVLRLFCCEVTACHVR
jgi:hypothetical protein